MQYGHFIDGELILRSDARFLPVSDPALGQRVAEVAVANDEEIDRAVDIAHSAFGRWSQTSPAKRAQILFNFRSLLEQHQDALVEDVCVHHGKIRQDALGEVMRAIELVEYMTAIPTLLRGRYSQQVSSGMDCYTVRQPLGVCVGVTPFNFPIMVPVWQFITAIACGNTFILKPSEHVPAAPLRLAQLMLEAGCPEGVFNVLNGDQTVVESLLYHPQVQAFACVGSTRVARTIYNTAINQGKRAHAFGGAKNHAVLMPDADMDQAAQAILGAAFGAAGERCMALSVVVAVGSTTAEALITRLQDQVGSITLGAWNNPQSTMGPLVSQAHRQCIIAFIEQGLEEGAQLIIDGRDATVSSYENGFFIGPCVFDRVTTDMALYQEEIFGPVLAIVHADNFEQALTYVNTHQYGNGAVLFTRDGDVAREFAARVEVGMVGINVPIPVPVAFHSFGGWKQSMFGDIGMHGDAAIQFYTRSKSVTCQWPANIHQGASFTMPHHIEKEALS